MRRPCLLCKNVPVSRLPAMMRTLAALLLGLLAPVPSAHAAARKAPVLVLPYAVFPGVPDSVGARIGELLSQELRGRDELKLVELKPQPARPKADPLAQARAALGQAAGLAQKSRHAAAADALEKAISVFTANPKALDESAGKLLSDAALQLAVERLVAGDEDGGEAALAQLVRLSPEREVNAADYPPAFIVELSGVRRRLLAAPHGSLRVLAAPGEGEARVLLDGRAVRSAPVLVKDLIPGEHFVRVERAGVAWGRKIVVIAGVETRVAPQPGFDGPTAELTGALLQGELDRAAVSAAARLARAAGAQFAVFGAVVKSKDGLLVRSFLCAEKGERVLALTPLVLDRELLGGVVQMVKVGDDVAAKLASPFAEPALPLALESASGSTYEVAAAPPPPAPPEPPALALAPLIPPASVSSPSPPPSPSPSSVPFPFPSPSAAPEPARRVALPGAPVPEPAQKVTAPAPPQPVRPIEDPPSRALVIPRQPTPDDAEPAARPAKPAPPPVQQHLQALEPDAIKTVREAPPKQSHTVLWIVAGVVVAGAAGVGGYFLWQSMQTPATANVNATWGH